MSSAEGDGGDGHLSKQARVAVAASVISAASSARMSMARTMSMRSKSGRVRIQRESALQRLRTSMRNVDMVVLLDTFFPIMHPESTLKTTWDMLIMSFVVYTALVVPLELSYGLVESPVRQGLEYAMDVMFLLDLLGNFRTAYFDHQVRRACVRRAGRGV